MTSRQSIVFQLFMLFTTLIIWQCEQSPIAKSSPVVSDKNPEFIGGQKELFKYLNAFDLDVEINVKSKPESLERSHTIVI